eukprot:6411421-Amphidinium_carterae.1
MTCRFECGSFLTLDCMPSIPLCADFMACASLASAKLQDELAPAWSSRSGESDSTVERTSKLVHA